VPVNSLKAPVLTHWGFVLSVVRAG